MLLNKNVISRKVIIKQIMSNTIIDSHSYEVYLNTCILLYENNIPPFDVMNFFIYHEPCKTALCCGLIQLNTSYVHLVCTSLYFSAVYYEGFLTFVVKASEQLSLYYHSL